jgi:hypothetical protein
LEGERNFARPSQGEVLQVKMNNSGHPLTGGYSTLVQQRTKSTHAGDALQLLAEASAALLVTPAVSSAKSLI